MARAIAFDRRNDGVDAPALAVGMIAEPVAMTEHECGGEPTRGVVAIEDAALAEVYGRRRLQQCHHLVPRRLEVTLRKLFLTVDPLSATPREHQPEPSLGEFASCLVRFGAQPLGRNELEIGDALDPARVPVGRIEASGQKAERWQARHARRLGSASERGTPRRVSRLRRPADAALFSQLDPAVLEGVPIADHLLEQGRLWE